MKKKGGRRLYEKVGKSMRWVTTNTQLANRINGGNMFTEAEPIMESALNAIIQEIMNIAVLMDIIGRI
ncbi:MAG: hypothetical protein FWE36_08675 [Erysipelotrichales bacterium]|nr:hypothetical protein [Erysipelotrichales bacterium]